MLPLCIQSSVVCIWKYLRQFHLSPHIICKCIITHELCICSYIKTHLFNTCVQIYICVSRHVLLSVLILYIVELSYKKLRKPYIFGTTLGQAMLSLAGWRRKIQLFCLLFLLSWNKFYGTAQNDIFYHVLLKYWI